MDQVVSADPIAEKDESIIEDLSIDRLMVSEGLIEPPVESVITESMVLDPIVMEALVNEVEEDSHEEDCPVDGRMHNISLTESVDMVACGECRDDSQVSCAPSTIVDIIPDEVNMPPVNGDMDEGHHVEEVIERVPAPSPAEPSTTPIEVDEECVDISESLNKALEKIPAPDETSPSPIPIIPNLNLSQYSCGFVDSMRGYCSDVSSEEEDMRQIPNIASARSVRSANVQVTSRICNPDNQKESTENKQSNKGCFSKLFGCGRMQK